MQSVCADFLYFLNLMQFLYSAVSLFPVKTTWIITDQCFDLTATAPLKTLPLSHLSHWENAVLEFGVLGSLKKRLSQNWKKTTILWRASQCHGRFYPLLCVKLMTEQRLQMIYYQSQVVTMVVRKFLLQAELWPAEVEVIVEKKKSLLWSNLSICTVCL